MVGISRGLGIRTIAEFVKDAETVALLDEYGVDFAQGYYVGRPDLLTQVRTSRTKRRS
jgi:EAL domain-containing protein (putative c-di-GMP-specific phosphodiesterase class I)